MYLIDDEPPFCVEWSQNEHAEDKPRDHFHSYAEAAAVYEDKARRFRCVYFWEQGIWYDKQQRPKQAWFLFLWKDTTYDERPEGRGVGLMPEKRKGLHSYEPLPDPSASAPAE